MKLTADVNEKLALEKMRGKLLADIEKFHKAARKFIPPAALATSDLAADSGSLGAEWDDLT